MLQLQLSLFSLVEVLKVRLALILRSRLACLYWHMLLASLSLSIEECDCVNCTRGEKADSSAAEFRHLPCAAGLALFVPSYSLLDLEN